MERAVLMPEMSDLLVRLFCEDWPYIDHAVFKRTARRNGLIVLENRDGSLSLARFSILATIPFTQDCHKA